MTSKAELAALLIRDLKTKSEKIRALAKAGYLRTEISELLGIRYQHVRKVLLDAGITDGLGNSKQVPQRAIPVADAPSPRIPSTVLLSAGFSLVGTWKLDSAGIISFDGQVPNEPGVYAFVLVDEVVYIGVSWRSLRGRMSQYKRGDPRQRTSARINQRIVTELQTGKLVKVLVAMPKHMEWNGLPVSTASGLEVGLIQAMRPTWNIQTGK